MKLKTIFLLLITILCLSLTGCKKKYTVTFVDFDGNVIKEVEVNKNGSTIAPIVPIKDGFEFVGWDNSFDNVTKDITVRAMYNEIAKTENCIVSFCDENNNVIGTVNVTKGNRVPVPNEPEKPGYLFLGWYNGNTKWDFLNMSVNDNIRLTQKWEAQYVTITFNTNGGSSISPIIETWGSNVTKPSDPVKEGYTFIGWDKEIPSVMPKGDLTINAIWQINKYTIEFNTNGGSKIDSITLDYGANITKPKDPTKDYSIFLGWDKEIPSTMPAKNLVFVAKWETKKYTVSFDTNGGELKDSIQLAYGTSLLTIDDPIRTDYGFIGWENAPETMPGENITLKANWCYIPDTFIILNGAIQSYIGTNTDVIIPRSYSINGELVYITEIKYYAFYYSKINSITLSDKIITISPNSFYSIYNLTEFIVHPNNRGYQAIDGNLYSKDGRTLIRYAAGKSDEHYTIPDNVITIEEHCFANARNLKNITFSKYMTTISKYAFYDAGLTEVEIPSYIRTIDDYAFANILIETITIPNTVRKIGKNCFAQCYYLTDVIFEENSSITTLSERLFENCEKLSNIEIPASITTIEGSVFIACDLLTSITVNENNQNFKTIDGNLYTTDEKTLVAYAPGKLDTTFTLPTCVEYINERAFENSKLTEFIVPNDSSLIEIGNFAFFYCNLLNNINFGENCKLEKIGRQAFSYCDKLITFDIPRYVSDLAFDAFFGSINIVAVNVDSNNTTYRSIDGNIYSGSELIYFASGKEITTFNIPNNVTSIESHAFTCCKYLENVVISDSVLYIDSYAFYMASNIKTVYIPDSVSRIDVRGFSYCDSLKINCEATSQPSGWEIDWNYDSCPVEWGYTAE